MGLEEISPEEEKNVHEEMERAEPDTNLDETLGKDIVSQFVFINM